jgi:hypothetical protein
MVFVIRRLVRKGNVPLVEDMLQQIFKQIVVNVKLRMTTKMNHVVLTLKLGLMANAEIDFDRCNQPDALIDAEIDRCNATIASILAFRCIHCMHAMHCMYCKKAIDQEGIMEK